MKPAIRQRLKQKQVGARPLSEVEQLEQQIRSLLNEAARMGHFFLEILLTNQQSFLLATQPLCFSVAEPESVWSRLETWERFGVLPGGEPKLNLKTFKEESGCLRVLPMTQLHCLHGTVMLRSHYDVSSMQLTRLTPTSLKRLKPESDSLLVHPHAVVGFRYPTFVMESVCFTQPLLQRGAMMFAFSLKE